MTASTSPTSCCETFVTRLFPLAKAWRIAGVQKKLAFVSYGYRSVVQRPLSLTM